MGSITEPPRNPYRHLKSIPECCNKNTVAEEQPLRTRILDPYEQYIGKFPNRKAYNKVHARFPKFSGRMLIHVAGLVDYLYQVSTSAYLAPIGLIGTPITRGKRHQSTWPGIHFDLELWTLY